MNLLIENLNSEILNGVDAIKTIKGIFTKENIQDQLNNLYYNKVIIDITAIDNYLYFKSLFSFLELFDKDKIILYLDSNISKEYMSKLVQEGYYNFTKNASSISFLVSHPNTLKDVEKYLETTPNSLNILNDSL